MKPARGSRRREACGYRDIVRIAVYHNLPYGGAIRAMREQIKRLGDQVEAIYTFGNTTNRGQEPDERTVHFSLEQHRGLKRPFGRLNGFVSILNLRLMHKACRRIAERIDSEGYDVVLVHSCFTTQTPPILQYLKTPTVYYCHEPLRAIHEPLIKGRAFTPIADPADILFARVAAVSEYRGLAAATKVLSNSYHIRESLLKLYGVDSDVCYLAVDTDLFRPKDLPKQRMVISVGALAPFKGHEFIIRSLATIEAEKRPLLMIVCGVYKLEGIEPLQQMCDGLGVRVKFFPGATDEELVDLYNRASVTAYAPILEPFGLIPLESMACGTPVVGVAEGGVRETIADGITGVLTRRDPEEFAAALMRFVEDTALSTEMGHAGRECVLAKWTWDKSIRQLEGALAEAARR